MLSLRLRSVAPRAAQLLTPHAALLRTSAVRMADDGERKNIGSLMLTFTVPDKALYEGVPVEMAILPGGDGMFGVMPNHVPTIAELKPGVVSVQEESGGPLIKYFISGGFASSKQRCRATSAMPRAETAFGRRRAPERKGCRLSASSFASCAVAWAASSRCRPLSALALPRSIPRPPIHLCSHPPPLPRAQ